VEIIFHVMTVALAVKDNKFLNLLLIFIIKTQLCV